MKNDFIERWEKEKKNGYVSLRHGMRPEYQLFRDKGQELDYIVQKIYNFTSQEKAALIAFLNTLTDTAFLSDEKFSDPFK